VNWKLGRSGFTLTLATQVVACSSCATSCAQQSGARDATAPTRRSADRDAHWNGAAADIVARAAGIDEAQSSLLPEEKWRRSAN